MNIKQHSPTIDKEMQAVVKELDITKQEALAMIKHGLEQACIGARLYGLFISGKIKENEY